MNRIHNKHNITNICYHIIWIPKYRKHLLTAHIKEELKVILIQKCAELNIELVEYEIMPDHIHLFIRSNAILNISYIIKILKGSSSFILRSKFTYLKRYKSLWTRSYFVETIGAINANTIIKYIKNQTK